MYNAIVVKVSFNKELAIVGENCKCEFSKEIAIDRRFSSNLEKVIENVYSKLDDCKIAIYPADGNHFDIAEIGKGYYNFYDANGRVTFERLSKKTISAIIDKVNDEIDKAESEES